MSKPFKNLIEKMPAERQERIKQKAKNLKTQMALGELRRALELTQEQVAGSLNMNQAAISKFEHQSVFYGSNRIAAESRSHRSNYIILVCGSGFQPR